MNWILGIPGPYRYEFGNAGRPAGAFERQDVNSESSPWNWTPCLVGWGEHVGQGWEYEIRLHSGEQLVGFRPAQRRPGCLCAGRQPPSLEVQQDVPGVDAFVIERQV